MLADNPEPKRIAHTIEKINGVWYIWEGDPKVLRTQETIAGPFDKRWKALNAVMELAHGTPR